MRFIEEQGIQVLNVAGPRLSNWEQGCGFALRVMALKGSSHEGLGLDIKSSPFTHRVVLAYYVLAITIQLIFFRKHH